MRIPFLSKRPTRSSNSEKLISATATDQQFHHFSAHMKRDIGLADQQFFHMGRALSLMIVRDIVFRSDR